MPVEADNQVPVTRRQFLQTATVAASTMVALSSAACRQQLARVTVLHAKDYGKNLSDLLKQGMKNHPLNLHGRRIVLKPNLVEYHAARRINTNPLIVAAAIDCFKSLGAGEVIVADGPGHQRDTEMLLEVSGLGEIVRSEKVRFVDLNTDNIHCVKTASNFTTLGELWLPETILNADLVVSMPKMKTHHWAGVTLSLKNLFGVIPSVRYGWPKNVLHWHGIDQSIADIATTVKPGFTIIDGIEGMEGNGPLHGDTVSSQVIVMSESLTAADATAARLMGINPELVKHLELMRNLGAPLREKQIVQTGERLDRYHREFQLIESFAHLRI